MQIKMQTSTLVSKHIQFKLKKGLQTLERRLMNEVLFQCHTINKIIEKFFQRSFSQQNCDHCNVDKIFQGHTK